MIAQFALRLLCGISLMWSVMPRGEVTAGFFRIQMLVALALSVLAALTLGSLAGLGAASLGEISTRAAVVACLFMAGVAYVGSVVWTLNRRTAGAICVYIIAIASTGLLLWGKVSGQDSPATALAFLAPLSELSSALVLGAALTAMLLGHWYLTAPTMSIAPLARLNVFLGVATLLRLILSATALVLAWQQVSSPLHWTWLTLRWLAGIVGLLIVVLLVARILRYRNTQSATGVLFAGVILTFIGELSAALLERELAVPF
jgi:hypothetical protein